MIPFRAMVLTVLVLFLVGCGAPADAPTPPSAATPTISIPDASASRATPSPSTAPSPAGPANLQAFRDPTGGYALDIPRGWTIQDVDPQAKQGQRGYYVTFLSWEQKTPWKGELPAGGTMLQVTVSRWEPLDLAKYVTMRKEAWASSKVAILSEEEWTLAGNLRAVRIVLKADKGNEFVLLTLIQDHFLTVTGSGDLNQIVELARTLRPVTLTP